MLEDFRFGLRTLRKSPGFTLVAVTALALGIGVNATVFSLVNGILFKNLPFQDSERVLYLTSVAAHSGDRMGVSYPDFRDFQAQVKSFTALGANTGCLGNFSDSAAFPENYRCSQITANTFRVIGQKPILGRDFLSEDEQPGAAAVAILSYGLWETRYGRDAGVIGRTVRINSIPTRVIGVMAKDVQFPPEVQLWLPLIPSAAMQKDRSDRGLSVFGRLAPDATPALARAEIATLAGNLAAQFPATNQDIAVLVRSFTETNLKRQIRTVFLAMLGAVGFVLLIACANVANLLLARAMARAREISIRTALGAARWRVIRQLLAESLILSAAGGMLGLLIAQWGTRAFDAAIIPTGKPAWIDFSLDYRVFGYLAAISVASGIVFGLAPALRLSRLDVTSGLKAGSIGAGTHRRTRRLSSALVVFETTLAVVLLAGAGLLIRSFLNAYESPAGFETSHLLTMRLYAPPGKYPQAAEQFALYQRLAGEIAALPGVQSVTQVSSLPGNGGSSQRIELEGASQRSALSLIAGANYFDTIQVRPVAGRAFTAADGASGAPVAIVNQGFVRTHLAGRDPLGARFRFNRGPAPQPWVTIIGVVPDVTQSDFTHTRDEPLVYLPLRQEPRLGMSLLIRTAVPPASLGEACRRAVQSVDPDLPARDVITLDQQLALSTWPLRVFGSMFAIFAGIALTLASVGLYAVAAHMVSQRTHEIGVRVALGASRQSILRMIYLQGMRPMFLGLAIGLAAAAGLTRVLAALLSGVSATDPMIFGIVAAVLAAAAIVGCTVPARRAIRVDAAIALRHE